MTDPAREPFLFVKLELERHEAAELNRRGDVKEAVKKMALVELMAGELKHLLARKALVTDTTHA